MYAQTRQIDVIPIYLKVLMITLCRRDAVVTAYVVDFSLMALPCSQHLHRIEATCILNKNLFEGSHHFHK